MIIGLAGTDSAMKSRLRDHLEKKSFYPISTPDLDGLEQDNADKAALEGAIAEYARRERRFGGLAAADLEAGHGVGEHDGIGGGPGALVVGVAGRDPRRHRLR